MLKPKKRITKRQIKEDKFVTYYFKTTDFAREHVREIASAVGLLALILVGYTVYARAQLSKEKNALTEFAKARAEYFNGNYDTAAILLQGVVDSHGGTASGRLATFYLADAYFHEKKFHEAQKYFAEYSTNADDSILEASAIAGIAACLEEKGQFAEAAETYRRAANQFRDEFMAPQNLLNSARCLKLAGNEEGARAVLNELIENYPRSQVKNEAEMFLAEIMS
ncbi:tetratricopeptide repeat protein [bacterium]|nr:tetratricopeptide repeat protein [bacterium]